MILITIEDLEYTKEFEELSKLIEKVFQKIFILYKI